MNKSLIEIMRLLEFSDSTLPVGTFSFSNGLETAAEMGLVSDAATLERYTANIVRQAAYTDCITAMHALRACYLDDYEGILDADRQTIICKMNAEARQMTQRMGKKMAELSQQILHNNIMERWCADINASRTPGCYPVAQGMVFALCGLSERELFAAHQYGVMSMVLSAALRCVRVSHYDTQRILFRLSRDIPALYDDVSPLSFEDMNTFVPQTDILASLHEKGTMRMFMN